METTDTTTTITVETISDAKDKSAPPKNLSNSDELKAASALLPTSSANAYEGHYTWTIDDWMPVIIILVSIVVPIGALWAFNALFS